MNGPHTDLASRVRWAVTPPEPIRSGLVPHLSRRWGNSHSIHLNAAATLALANSIAGYSDDAREYRHNRLDQRIIDFNAYLFPILDNRRGDPAGQGPCLDVARAEVGDCAQERTRLGDGTLGPAGTIGAAAHRRKLHVPELCKIGWKPA